MAEFIIADDTEKHLRTQGYRCIAGVDEVGRGPWAGPVVAAAVVLPPEIPQILYGCRDSKKLSSKKRDALCDVILQTCAVGLGEASVEEIDTLNIREATFVAMQRALAALPQTPDYALIDGNAVPRGLAIPVETVVKGDDKVLSIACASVVAKVTRDRLMHGLHAVFPQYNWQKNAGYGTKDHQTGLHLHGITPHHRKSFAPIRALLG